MRAILDFLSNNELASALIAATILAAVGGSGSGSVTDGIALIFIDSCSIRNREQTLIFEAQPLSHRTRSFLPNELRRSVPAIRRFAGMRRKKSRGRLLLDATELTTRIIHRRFSDR